LVILFFTKGDSFFVQLIVIFLISTILIFDVKFIVLFEIIEIFFISISFDVPPIITYVFTMPSFRL